MKQCTKQHRKQPKTLVPKMIECINRSECADTVSSDALNIGCINNKSSASNNIKNNRIDFKKTGNINSTSNNNNPLNLNYKSGNNNINENNRLISTETRIKNIANNPVRSDAFKFNTKDSNSFKMSTKKSGY